MTVAVTTALAFSHGGYVAAGWGIVAGTLATYVAVTLQRGRRLSRQVPEQERRWTAS